MTMVPVMTMAENCPSESDVSTVESSWRQAEDGASSIAPRRTSRRPIASEKQGARQQQAADGADGVMPNSTQQDGKGNSHVRQCDWCGEEFVTHRPWGRFCCATHRANYWYAQREAEGQQGGG